MNMYLEHANITVHDIDEAMRFLQTAFPHFAIRGQGKSGDRRWLHIGTDTTYVALNDASSVSKNKTPHKDYDGVGINHIGFVVENVNDIARRLEEKGYQASYPRTEEKYRTRIYYYDGSGIEYEFVEYFSEEPEKRNLYS